MLLRPSFASHMGICFDAAALSVPVPVLRGRGALPEVLRGDLDEGDGGQRAAEGGQQPPDGRAHVDALAARGGGSVHDRLRNSTART